MQTKTVVFKNVLVGCGQCLLSMFWFILTHWASQQYSYLRFEIELYELASPCLCLQYYRCLSTFLPIPITELIGCHQQLTQNYICCLAASAASPLLDVSAGQQKQLGSPVFVKRKRRRFVSAPNTQNIFFKEGHILITSHPLSPVESVWSVMWVSIVGFSP